MNWKIILCFFLSLYLGMAQIVAKEYKEESKKPIEEIVIMGHPLSSGGLAQPIDILYGEKLDRKVTDTIGGTLSFKPGLHTTFFGPAVGRPVIHGLDGVRVKVMEDRIDSMDVSTGSSDHSVSINPLVASEIEVLKGANTLLYGPGAIGGVVNVRTGRIPTLVPDRAVMGKLDVRAIDNGGATQGAVRFDGGKGSFAWHVDGFFKDANDIMIPGFAQSARMRAIEETYEGGEEGHEGDEDEFVQGKLPSSYYQTHGGAVGFSFIDNNANFIGVAISQMKKEYGLPGFAHSHEEEGEPDEEGEHHDEEHEEGSPHIDLEQMRIDLKMGLSTSLSGWENFKLDIGLNSYEHAEIESSGEVGTKFENESWEIRMEAGHAPVAQWSGIVGVQSNHRDYVASGEEALTPPVGTTSHGLFWVGQKNFEKLQVETGVRFDSVTHKPKEKQDKQFTGGSASLGLIIPFKKSWRFSSSVDYASRAPVSEELFSDGPHFASRSFEVGNPNLNNEVALNFSTTLSYKSTGGSALVTAYLTDFTNFIYQMETGEERDGLPLRLFTQNKAFFAGFDVEASLPVFKWRGGELELKTFFDTVSGKVDVSGNKNLPRIPPNRVGVGFELTQGSFIATLDYIHAFEQKDITDYELATDAYDDLEAYLGWDLPISGLETSLFVVGRNLTNSEQRRHTSVIKDIAPERGRSLEGGLRIIF